MFQFYNRNKAIPSFTSSSREIGDLVIPVIFNEKSLMRFIIVLLRKHNSKVKHIMKINDSLIFRIQRTYDGLILEMLS